MNNFNQYESTLIYEFRQWFSSVHEDYDFSRWNTILILTEAKKKSFSLQELIKLLPVHKSELNQVEMYNSFGKLGFKLSHDSITVNNIDDRIFPALYKKDELNYVVTRINRGENSSILECISPMSKEFVEIEVDNQSKHNFVIFSEIEDGEKDISEEHNKIGESWFKPVIERFDPLFYQIFFTTLVLGIFSVLSPLFIMYSFSLVSDGSYSNLILIALGAVFSLGVEFLIRGIRSKSINWISSRIGHIVGLKVFERLLWLPSHNIETSSTSAQISKIKTFDTVRDFIQGPTFKTVLDLPISIVSFIILCVVGKKLAFVPLGTIAAYFIISFFINFKLWRLTKRNLKLQGEKQGLLLETFEKRFSLRSAGLSETFLDRNKNLSAESNFSRFKLNFLSNIIDTLIQTITALSVVLLIFSGIKLVWAGELTSVSIIISTILFGKVIQPFYVLASSLPKIQQVYNIINQLNALMKMKTEHSEESLKKKKVGEFEGNIKFSRVGVKFNKESTPLFTNTNINIQKGESISITGLNGSGKSTLLKLIIGLNKPQVGSISIDGCDIRQTSANRLRGNIAYLPQSPQFFKGTIIDNVRMGNPLASRSQLDYVLEELQLFDDLKQIKGGLKAQVNTDLLNTASSSLIYKLALARTLVSSSNIVLLDELPFSILSGPIGERMFKFIESWKGHRTVIFVSNNEDFIKLSDKAILLQHNRSPLISKPEHILNEVNREKLAI